MSTSLSLEDESVKIKLDKGPSKRLDSNSRTFREQYSRKHFIKVAGLRNCRTFKKLQNEIACKKQKQNNPTASGNLKRSRVQFKE